MTISDVIQHPVCASVWITEYRVGHIVCTGYHFPASVYCTLLFSSFNLGINSRSVGDKLKEPSNFTLNQSPDCSLFLTILWDSRYFENFVRIHYNHDTFPKFPEAFLLPPIILHSLCRCSCWLNCLMGFGWHGIFCFCTFRVALATRSYVFVSVCYTPSLHCLVWD